MRRGAAGLSLWAQVNTSACDVPGAHLGVRALGGVSTSGWAWGAWACEQGAHTAGGASQPAAAVVGAHPAPHGPSVLYTCGSSTCSTQAAGTGEAALQYAALLPRGVHGPTSALQLRAGCPPAAWPQPALLAAGGAAPGGPAAASLSVSVLPGSAERWRTRTQARHIPPAGSCGYSSSSGGGGGNSSRGGSGASSSGRYYYPQSNHQEEWQLAEPLLRSFSQRHTQARAEGQQEQERQQEQEQGEGQLGPGEGEQKQELSFRYGLAHPSVSLERRRQLHESQGRAGPQWQTQRSGAQQETHMQRLPEPSSGLQGRLPSFLRIWTSDPADDVRPPQQRQQQPSQQQQKAHAQQRQQQRQQQQQQQRQQPVSQGQHMAVKAYHIGAEIDLLRFLAEEDIPHRLLGRDHAIVRADADLTADTVLAGTQALPSQRVFVVYRFGAVIFFGADEEADKLWLARLLDYTREPLAAPLEDEATLVVRADLQPWCTLEPDAIVVRQLDMGNLRVISNILGQSVALDHYTAKVDAALTAFTPILREIATTGASANMRSDSLLKLIGENSLLYTEVVSKLGLLDMSETAWKTDRYYEVWRQLRAEYEIDRRFDGLNRKLGPMLENAKFILEVRGDRKSEAAEKTIILLIAAEILIHMYGGELAGALAAGARALGSAVF